MTRQTKRIPVSRMTDSQIAARLERDGYCTMIGREAEIRQASQNGTLLWTSKRLTSTANSGGFDVRPER